MFCSQKFYYTNDFFLLSFLLSCSSLKFSFGLINIKMLTVFYNFCGFCCLYDLNIPLNFYFYWYAKNIWNIRKGYALVFSSKPNETFNQTEGRTDSFFQTLIVCRYVFDDFSCVFS